MTLRKPTYYNQDDRRMKISFLTLFFLLLGVTFTVISFVAPDKAGSLLCAVRGHKPAPPLSLIMEGGKVQKLRVQTYNCGRCDQMLEVK